MHISMRLRYSVYDQRIRRRHFRSNGVRTVKPGEKYVFGGKEYSAAANEIVIVDDANDLLIVWMQGAAPSVMAVRSVMMQ